MNINKTYLYMGGIGVSCLAVGATGGFFIAKKKFYGELRTIIADELAETKKHYELRIKQLKEKPASPQEALAQVERTKAAEEKITEEANRIAQEQGYKRPETPAVAYNRVVREREEGAHKIDAHNIWQDQNPEDREPPKSLRGPDGRFASPNKILNGTSIQETPAIELISVEDFLGDDMGYEQKNLIWYVDGEEGTLVDHRTDEPVDIKEVGGADILSLLPTTTEDDNGDRIICVRNNANSIDYEIKLSEANLTEVLDLSQD